MSLYLNSLLRVCVCFLQRYLAAVVLLLPAVTSAAVGLKDVQSSNGPDVALYYGDRLPLSQLRMFDWVVLQSSRLDSEHVSSVAGTGVIPLAYLSIGEVAQSAAYRSRMQDRWILGENPDWNSLVLDVRQDALVDFLVDDLAAGMWAKGFRGFFLDTLDSYRLSDQGRQDPAAFEDALVHIIQGLKQRWPKAKIILNRGFELVPRVHDSIDMVAFESLYSGIAHADTNPAGGKPKPSSGYAPIRQSDRDWLLARANEVMAAGLPVLAIDYTSPSDHRSRADIADKIASHDIIPWISDRDLNGFGRGRLDTVSRRILAVHDSLEAAVSNTSAHRYAAMPLEYQGYWLDYVHAGDPALNDIDTTGAYAGIVVWLEHERKSETRLCKWLLEQQQRTGLPVVFMERLPDDQACYTVAGVEPFDGEVSALSISSVRTSTDGKPIGSFGEFEGKTGYQPVLQAVTLLSKNDESVVSPPWVSMTTPSGETAHPVAVTPEGGYALAPFVFERGLADDRFWMFDPFAFLASALKLTVLPVPDVTTENGRRILTSHIDGDGFASVAEIPGTPLAGAAIYREILQKYRFPHTVSIIEAEVSPKGIYPLSAKAAEAVAKKIFRLPNVEIASHTYSHPFFWAVLEGNSTVEATDYGFSLSIPGYQLNIDREIAGSVEYINNRLAPGGKHVEVFLWSGDGKPGPSALRAVAKLGLLNVNGGDTKVVNGDSSLTQVWPTGVPIGSFRQIYAPVMNENRYTNLWKGPYYGFRRVVETFELLDSPRRLKPISIYYHFYSGSKLSALNALHQIYDWAVAQPVVPMYLSEYARRANSFYDASFARLDDGGWLIKHDGNLKTLRLPHQLSEGLTKDQTLDLAASDGVIGMKPGVDGMYLHLVGNTAIVRFGPETLAAKAPYLLSSNAIITYWQTSVTTNGSEHITVSARSGMGNVVLEIANARTCSLAQGQKGAAFRSRKSSAGALTLSFDSASISAVALDCR